MLTLLVYSVSYNFSNTTKFQKCDFEKDQCGWTNVANSADDFDWERAQAETLSYGTGPIVDHTLGSSDGASLFLSREIDASFNSISSRNSLSTYVVTHVLLDGS